MMTCAIEKISHTKNTHSEVIRVNFNCWVSFKLAIAKTSGTNGYVFGIEIFKNRKEDTPEQHHSRSAALTIHHTSKVHSIYLCS
jgi:hypothetical protein